jgi:hypothetical protein
MGTINGAFVRYGGLAIVVFCRNHSPPNAPYIILFSIASGCFSGSSPLSFHGSATYPLVSQASE